MTVLAGEDASGVFPGSVRLLAGKLVGFRVATIRSTGEVRALEDAFRVAVADLQGRVVLCADLRRLQVMESEVAASMLDGFRTMNARLLRSAILLPANAPTIRLQMERLLREAKNGDRRACVDAAEVKAWLLSYLDDDERARLDEFLAPRSP